MGLTSDELLYLEQSLKRKANEVELNMVSAEWSEHCSYKSSKPYLKLLPRRGKYILEGNYDTTFLDIGDGYVITIHIESHNHPSAVEPYGGAATGVGGVVRDILSVGARPIALLDALRFGELNAHTKWLFKNVVKGIADYGNCIGIPTIAGEVEFDPSFEGYCLVDVSCIGIAKKEDMIPNRAEKGDYIILAGGSTGRDGIHGAAFASKALEGEDRSAVQIPDPFMEKLLIDATLEAVEKRCIKSMKDLGGGGLACALSETADKFGVGMDIILDKVYLREDMLAEEIIISESQERMLYIIDKNNLEEFKYILNKYEIPYSIIGEVTDSKNLKIIYNNNTVADIPATLVANAPLARRDAKPIKYENYIKPKEINDGLKDVILRLLADPSIASKRWAYEQYDHEVGLRTIIKPGFRDASVIRLHDNKFLAVKLDGNSKHCYLDPYNGAKGCFAEACRNIVSLGAEPIGMVDHLQFGNPENAETYYSFIESIKGLRDYSNALSIPCVGGKVSFYNESKNGEIKPSPVIGVIGLLDKVPNSNINEGDMIVVTGITKDELGGSEYYEYIHHIVGGIVPKPNEMLDKELFPIIRRLVKEGAANYVHDCSKGGFAIALIEMCMANNIGAEVDPKLLLNECNRLDDLLFSESHSRFIIAIDKSKIEEIKHLSIPYSIVGVFKGDSITFNNSISIDLDETNDAYNSLERVMEYG